MRFGMSMHKGKSHYITIVSKKNNWRPTKGEPEVPDCLDYLARPHMKKVGDMLQIPDSSPSFTLLMAYLEGKDPEGVEISRAADSIAHRLIHEFGLQREINKVCMRMQRRGLDNPSAPRILTMHLFKILRDRVSV